MQLTASLLFALLSTSVLALPQDVRDTPPPTTTITITVKPPKITTTATLTTTSTLTVIATVTTSHPARQPVPA